MATFHMINVVVNILFVLLISCSVSNATIGINWGRQSITKMVPSMVVDVLLQNNVKEAKIYNADENIIKAFRGTDIGLTINAYELQSISTPELARDWVQQKVLSYPDVYIKYILIGKSNAFGAARYAKRSFFDIVNAASYVQDALNEAGQGNKTKAVISHAFSGVLLSPRGALPSETVFQEDVREAMSAYLKLCAQNDIPFVYEFFPIAYIYVWGSDFDYGFFDNRSTWVIKDKNMEYRNLFEFIHDSFVWALKKIGAPDNIKIVVGQIGWPTDGFSGANTSTAERYYKGLLPFVMSNKGTPMRPGEPIDVYLHSLTDEKLNPAYVSFTRHWGIYRTNGEPKYKIDLSGQGRDIFPRPAKGMGLMPDRWCVFNNDTSDMAKVNRIFADTCQKADCTSMSPGGSCSMLTFNENVSYAFNSYFQSTFQSEESCNFEGLGTISLKDPSRNGCVFSVEVVRGSTDVINSNGSGHIDGIMSKFVILLLLTFVLLVSFF